MPTKKVPTPMQPVEWAKDGVIRFRQNRIVRDCIDFATARSNPGKPEFTTPFTHLDLNTIVMELQRGRYTVEEYEQFNQLIGYSVSGFGDLSLVRKRTVQEADKQAEALINRRRRRKAA